MHGFGGPKWMAMAEAMLWRPSVAPAEDPELWAQERVGKGELRAAKSRQLDCVCGRRAKTLQSRRGFW